MNAPRGWDWILAAAHRGGVGLPTGRGDASELEDTGLDRSPLEASEEGETLRVRSSGGAVLEVDRTGAWRASWTPDSETATLFDLYLPIAAPRTLVIAQVGQSLDGRVATSTGRAHYVTGPDDLLRLHRVRALVDAVVVGAGTADADDPQLTVRRTTGPSPWRVVLDPRGRVPESRRLFQEGPDPTLWLRRGVPEGPIAPHVQVAAPPGDVGDVDPAAVLTWLAARGATRVLVEGGGHTVSGFLRAGVLHRLHVTVAPLLIGEGPAGIHLPPVDALEDALRPPCRTYPLGTDVLFDLALSTPASLS